MTWILLRGIEVYNYNSVFFVGLFLFLFFKYMHRRDVEVPKSI